MRFKDYMKYRENLADVDKAIGLNFPSSDLTGAVSSMKDTNDPDQAIGAEIEIPTKTIAGKIRKIINRNTQRVTIYITTDEGGEASIEVPGDDFKNKGPLEGQRIEVNMLGRGDIPDTPNIQSWNVF